MADLRRWAFAALHTGLLVALAVWLLHLTVGLGDPLAGLNTALGLGLYALLWGVVWVTTGRAFAAASPADAGLRDLLVAGAAYGAATALGLLAAVVVAGVAVVLVSGGDPVTVLLLGLFGAVVAAAVGALVGVAFALLDSALVRLGDRLVPAAAAEA